jgi:protein-S-isoprenylcysteine O-methyltransferase Ste14
MFAIVRTIVYATLFIGLLLIYVPASLLSWSRIVRPSSFGILQILGLILGTVGAALALWCVFSFALIGKGTPAPFDPPRRLVVNGPYHFVRNPMYIGAGLALIGATLFYKSLPLLIYAFAFFLITHLFVVIYEEPMLRRSFLEDYDAYCRRVGRWWPRSRRVQ